MRDVVIGLDIDSTVMTHRYPDCGEDIGAIPWLKAALALDPDRVKFIICSMRSGREAAEAEEAAEAAEDLVIEEEVVEVEEVAEVAQVEEEETKKSGLHLPSSEDLSSTDISSLLKKFTLTPSQSRKPQSSIDSSPTLRPSSPMRSCASSPSKSKPRLVKELDSRLSSLPVIDKVTLVSVSSAPRRSKLPSRVPFSMPRSTLSQSEEDIGVPESVPSIPSQLRSRVSAVPASSE